MPVRMRIRYFIAPRVQTFHAGHNLARAAQFEAAVVARAVDGIGTRLP